MTFSPGSPDRARPRRPARASMHDVARVAGVSHQTVSRVINDSDLVRRETRERVEAAIAELGYHRSSAARALARRRTQRLGLVMEHGHLFGPRMVASGVRAAARLADFETVAEEVEQISRSTLASAVTRLQEADVEAVVVAVAHRHAHDMVAELRLSVPVVVAEGVEPGTHMAAAVDQAAGARLAIDHLVGVGRSRIAHLAGPVDWIEARQRLHGWRDAIEAHGLPRGRHLDGDWSAASGYVRGCRLLEGDLRVDAVFAANDLVALGLLRACHERGVRVPDDLAVVGFDDTPEASHFWPPLTSVRQDFVGLGSLAVKLALAGIDGDRDSVADLLVPELCVRASTTGAGVTDPAPVLPTDD